MAGGSSAERVAVRVTVRAAMTHAEMEKKCYHLLALIPATRGHAKFVTQYGKIECSGTPGNWMAAAGLIDLDRAQRTRNIGEFNAAIS
jgi:hypothetical protein